MRIHNQFTGGNIRVLEIRGDDVYVQNELRDTTTDWFYWAFCVEDAQGRTLTFHFDKAWLGYYGPAVSHDLYHWRWLNDTASPAASAEFTYTFSATEDRVYFAHNMLYHPAHFDDFCRELGLTQQVLCRSERGRDVPYLHIGEGGERIVLTARNHACEATGNYVLEGVLRELLREPLPGLDVVVVPFVDYDGVIDGDQGKNRAPHDQNRDWPVNGESIYAAVREIRRLALEKPVRYAFDYHSPWHVGGNNDWVFIVQKYAGMKAMTRFGNIWHRVNTPDALPYDVTGSMPPEVDWNVGPMPTCSSFMYDAAGAELSFSLETPYFSCSGTPFSPDAAREMGRCFAVALRLYHTRPVRLSFTGDILCNDPMNRWYQTADGYDFIPMFRSIWTRLPDADYLVGNAETPFAGEANDGYTHSRWQFNTPDAALDAFKKTGFDLLSLANNHCMDRGAAGIVATLDACDRVGIDHIGLYRTPEESEAVFVRNIGGIRVGFVNATYGTNAFAHHTFLQGDEKHMVRLTQPEETLDGSVHLLLSQEEIEQKTRELYGNGISPLAEPYLKQLEEDIRRTKEQSDFVIMLLHSGGQHNAAPDAYTKMLCEKIWEYGADLIVGNHPHVIHPSTLEDGFFTCYSLGNIMCSEAGWSRAGHIYDPDFSCILNLTLEKGEDDRITQHLTFRLCQIMHDPDRQKAPRVVNTYDQWRKDPYDAYRETILYYANLFMPGRNYIEPMDEYPIC